MNANRMTVKIASVLKGNEVKPLTYKGSKRLILQSSWSDFLGAS